MFLKSLQTVNGGCCDLVDSTTISTLINMLSFYWLFTNSRKLKVTSTFQDSLAVSLLDVF